MTFSTEFPARHTDTYAATGFVHAGVLLAFTELTYAAIERLLDFSKPDTTVAVPRETHAVYAAPLHWRDRAAVEVTTTAATEYGFDQDFTIRSAATGALVATISHRWVWLDTVTGRRVDLPEDVRTSLLSL